MVFFIILLYITHDLALRLIDAAAREILMVISEDIVRSRTSGIISSSTQDLCAMSFRMRHKCDRCFVTSFLN